MTEFKKPERVRHAIEAETLVTQEQVERHERAREIVDVMSETTCKLYLGLSMLFDAWDFHGAGFTVVHTIPPASRWRKQVLVKITTTTNILFVSVLGSKEWEQRVPMDVEEAVDVRNRARLHRRIASAIRKRIASRKRTNRPNPVRDADLYL